MVYNKIIKKPAFNLPVNKLVYILLTYIEFKPFKTI